MMLSDIDFIKSLNLQGKTLDVGSLNVNGSIRNCCKDLYYGIDLRKGSNVDIQASSHDLPFKSEIFDNVISIGTLEHDICFWTSIKEMKRVLKIGGRLILSVPDYKFKYHAHPKDYWRFSVDAVKLFFNNFLEITIWKSTINDDCIRIYGIK